MYERLGLKFGNSTNGTSPNGLSIRGKDFFDASFFHSEKTRPLFFKFIAELKEMCDVANPTLTHQFLKELVEEKRILRWYTQNIDGLEERVGLETSVTVKSTTQVKNIPVIGLHGTLGKLSCTVCKTSVEYEQHEVLKEGSAPGCGTCKDRIANRAEKGQRKIKGGFLRPDIVLYNEPHPQGDLIAEMLSSDLAKRPTMLLVIGTSLKVVGLKRMIKDLAKAVHTNSSDGLVVYMNKTEIQARSEWKGIFDYELVGECDQWVGLVREEFEKLKAPKSAKDKITASSKEDYAKTPVKPPAKSSKIETFFKHVKSSATNLSKSKKLQIADDKENVRTDNVAVVVGPMTRSKRRAAL